MARKYLIALVLVLALSLSGYLAYTYLPTLINMEQRKNAEKSWKKNGNLYTTTVTYESPAGEVSNTFILTLEKGIVKDVEVGISTENKSSLKYQTNFSNAIDSVVVGKKLSELGNIDRVSGASGTTKAFNDAIQKLQEQLS